MRVYPTEVKYAKFNSDSSDALQVWLDGAWRVLVPGVEDADGLWSASLSGTVHAIMVAHPDVVFPPAGSLTLSLGIHPTRLRRASNGEILTAATDPIIVDGASTWPVEWGSNPRPEDANLTRQAEQMAILALRTLTLNRVGGYTVTVLPCGSTCGHRTHEWNPHWHGGKFVNTCGCADNCSCAPVSAVYLEPPVGGVIEVRVDGLVVDPANYRVEDGVRLVRTDGIAWPACGSDDFTVTYSHGYPVDSLGARAAGALAAEFAKALTNTKGCRLPSNVVSVARQGMTMQMAQGLFPEGYTGLNEVDVWVRAWNPYGHKAIPTVWSPDIDTNRRVTWSAS